MEYVREIAAEESGKHLVNALLLAFALIAFLVGENLVGAAGISILAINSIHFGTETRKETDYSLHAFSPALLAFFPV